MFGHWLIYHHDNGQHLRFQEHQTTKNSRATIAIALLDFVFIYIFLFNFIYFLTQIQFLVTERHKLGRRMHGRLLTVNKGVLHFPVILRIRLLQIVDFSMCTTRADLSNN